MNEIHFVPRRRCIEELYNITAFISLNSIVINFTEAMTGNEFNKLGREVDVQLDFLSWIDGSLESETVINIIEN